MSLGAVEINLGECEKIAYLHPLVVRNHIILTEYMRELGDSEKNIYLLPLFLVMDGSNNMIILLSPIFF